tara:strand:- start:637 stop:1362 length:726 start_codon:yes stop_codon:yes gene_type:complete
MKRTIPLLIAAVTGFVLIVSHFVPPTASWGEKAMIWFDILASIAFVLGGGNLLKIHLQKISDRRAGWGFSLITITAFLVTMVIGLSKFGVPPAEKFPEYAWSGDFLAEGGGFWWIYQHVYLPLAATMFSLLAFFIASAAFRAFRAKNTEAIILLVTAFIVLMGRTYAGIWLSQPLELLGSKMFGDPTAFESLRLDKLVETIMGVFNLAGNRAINMGIALGIAALSLKVLMGVDRSYLGSED